MHFLDAQVHDWYVLVLHGVDEDINVGSTFLRFFITKDGGVLKSVSQDCNSAHRRHDLMDAARERNNVVRWEAGSLVLQIDGRLGIDDHLERISPLQDIVDIFRVVDSKFSIGGQEGYHVGLRAKDLLDVPGGEAAKNWRVARHLRRLLPLAEWIELQPLIRQRETLL